MSATPAAAAATTTATMHAMLRPPPEDCWVESATEAEVPGASGCNNIAAAASAAAATRPQKVLPPAALLAVVMRGSLHSHVRLLSRSTQDVAPCELQISVM